MSDIISNLLLTAVVYFTASYIYALYRVFSGNVTPFPLFVTRTNKVIGVLCVILLIVSIWI